MISQPPAYTATVRRLRREARLVLADRAATPSLRRLAWRFLKQHGATAHV